MSRDRGDCTWGIGDVSLQSIQLHVTVTLTTFKFIST